MAHFQISSGQVSLHHLLHAAFLAPVAAAGVLLGLKGGLWVAFLSLCLQIPAFIQAPLEGAMAWLPPVVWAVVYGGLGWLIGSLNELERLENQQQLASADLAMMGQAAAAVAHELKTPLVAIGGFALRMSQNTPEDHPHHRELGIIVDQVSHMENLLREMLDFSRPLVLRLTHHNLNQLVEEVMALAVPLAERAGVTMKSELSSEVRWVRVDGPRFKQVALNLLNNAIQATDEDGVVRLITELAGSSVVFKVADNGKGIPAERLEEIFSPFYTTKRQGTGLGLAISRKIIEAHQGHLAVTSDPGFGSKFYVHLPLSSGGAE